MLANAKWLCAVVEARAFSTFKELYEYVSAREPDWSPQYVQKIIRWTCKEENYDAKRGISPIRCNIRTGIYETALSCDELLEAHAERKGLINKGNLKYEKDNAKLTQGVFRSQHDEVISMMEKQLTALSEAVKESM